MKVLLVAAVQEELGDLEGVPVGVGPVVAAASAGSLLAERRPEAVILLGTAGSFPGGPPVGMVVASGVLGMADPLSASGIGYVPLPPEPLAGDPALLRAIGLPAARILTNLGVTTHPGLAAHFGESWEVEHMEAYAVARACEQEGIPFLAVLGIANRVGPDAHAEWRARRKEVQAAVQLHLRERGSALAAIPSGR